MANRVIKGAFQGTFVLRVSRPGYNVLDPALPKERLAFDSRWAEASNVLMRGSTTITNGGSVTVNFGFELPFVPFILIRIVGATKVYAFTGQCSVGFNGSFPQLIGFPDRFYYLNDELGPDYSGSRPLIYTLFRNIAG